MVTSDNEWSKLINKYCYLLQTYTFLNFFSGSNWAACIVEWRIRRMAACKWCCMIIIIMMMMIILMIMIIILPTTASQSGVWVPQTSRSFYYWQPVPRWRLLPLLANLGTPAMSPHTRKGNRYLSHWMNSGKREGRGGENCLCNKLPLLTKLQVHAQTTHKNTSNEEHMEFQRLLIY